MKKKIAKKLVLKKETLRDLDAAHLKVIVGATTPERTCTGVVCGYSEPYYCPNMPATRTCGC